MSKFPHNSMISPDGEISSLETYEGQTANQGLCLKNGSQRTAGRDQHQVKARPETHPSLSAQ